MCIWSSNITNSFTNIPKWFKNIWEWSDLEIFEIELKYIYINEREEENVYFVNSDEVVVQSDSPGA